VHRRLRKARGVQECHADILPSERWVGIIDARSLQNASVTKVTLQTVWVTARKKSTRPSKSRPGEPKKSKEQAPRCEGGGVPVTTNSVSNGFEGSSVKK